MTLGLQNPNRILEPRGNCRMPGCRFSCLKMCPSFARPWVWLLRAERRPLGSSEMPRQQGPGMQWSWRRTLNMYSWVSSWSYLKTLYFLLFFLFVWPKCRKQLAFVALFTHKWSFGLKFASQVVTLRRVLEGVLFKKHIFFSAGERHGRQCNRASHIEFSYHIEVRTLNARRCLGKKW